MRNTPSENASTRSLRIALYSHDTCGLGHMRRNLLIAEVLAQQFECNILLLTGAREATAFRFPDGIDAVTLPSLHKDGNEAYRARSLQFHLSELIRLRSGIIQTSIEIFQPDLFIVDKVPRGTMGELEKALEHIQHRASTKCVLGLRDILDKPETVRSEWKEAGNIEFVKHHYEAVWIYGDASIYDVTADLHFPPEIQRKTSFTGFLDPTIRLRDSSHDDRMAELLRFTGDRFFLCTVGGGQDGALLAENFIRSSFPEGVKGLILTGPHMPRAVSNRLQRLVDERPHLHLVRFLSEPLPLFQKAERIVCMGGYNTLCEVVATRQKALIIPRIEPREEQLIRANTLQKLHMVDVLHPHEMTPSALSDWFVTPFEAVEEAPPIDLRGLDRITELVRQLITPQSISSLKNEFQHVTQ